MKSCILQPEYLSSLYLILLLPCCSTSALFLIVFVCAITFPIVFLSIQPTPAKLTIIMACGFLAATVGSTLVLFTPKAILLLGGADVNESFEIVRAPSSGGRKGSSDPSESNTPGFGASVLSGWRNPNLLFSSYILGDNRSVVDHQASADAAALSHMERGTMQSGKPRIRVSSVGLIEQGEVKGDHGIHQHSHVGPVAINGEFIENKARSEMMHILEISADKSSELK